MLVAVVIFWPQSVTYWLDKEAKVNTDDVKIEMQIEDTGEAPETEEGAEAPPSFDVPAVDQAASVASGEGSDRVAR
jgi:hypothetical protein